MIRHVVLVASALALLGACGSSDDGSSTSGGSGGMPGGGGAFAGTGATVAGTGAVTSGTGAAPGSGGVTGSGGDTGAPGTGGLGVGTGGVAPACLPIGQTCEFSSDCCDGYCNKTGPVPSWMGCQKRCSQDSECATGCCMLFQGVDFGICQDAKWCACGDTAQRCGTTEPRCCDTHVCVGGDPQGTFFDCRAKCTTDADCPGGCCTLIPSLGQSACLTGVFCPSQPQ